VSERWKRPEVQAEDEGNELIFGTDVIACAIREAKTQHSGGIDAMVRDAIVNRTWTDGQPTEVDLSLAAMFNFWPKSRFRPKHFSQCT
jgi:hypothetical protein